MFVWFSKMENQLARDEINSNEVSGLMKFMVWFNI